MPVPARIIAVDDELPHLRGLVTGLNRSGWACLQVHYPDELGTVEPCQHARIVFTDLHLDAGGAFGDPTKNYGIVQSLLEVTVKPAGPYMLVVWTSFPEEAGKLADFLGSRMRSVSPPVAVVPLAKAGRLDADGNLTDPVAFVRDLRKLVADQPQFAALLNWEQRVLGAAAGTVAEILALTLPGKPGTPPPPKLAQVIAQLATAAVGRHNVEHDRFRAVNETLLPILADRVGVLRGEAADKAVWDHAFASTDLDATLAPFVAARLNRFLHVEDAPPAGAGCYRGAVVELPTELDGERFEARFGIKPESKDARREFGIKDGVGTDKWIWRLVQVQAACDAAQQNPGPLPFVLAAEVDWEERGQLRGGAWGSRCLTLSNREIRLVINARFLIDVPTKRAAGLKAVYRLREQIMGEVSHHLHSQGARPGIISFG
ncbi:hypothetical protein J4558_00530 [Leptolyngbya sp. 15MV]|nr:hypothetical protein J4558_00530 [Leptolyngbya sp. 15MV]